MIEGKPKAGGDAVQQTLDLMFKDPASGGDYQFTFPDGLKSYPPEPGAAAEERQGLSSANPSLQRLVQPVGEHGHPV